MPMSPFDADRLAMQQWDEDERVRRATRTYGPGDIAQQAYFNSVNDAATDAATGPGGYNRQWVPLLKGLQGKRFAGGGGLPTETYADPNHTGTLSLVPQSATAGTPTVTMPTVTMPTVTMPQASPTSVGVLKKRATNTPDPHMADQDAYLAQLFGTNPPDYRPTTPTPPTTPAPPTPAPTTTLRSTLPSTPQPSLGSVAALAQQLGIDDDEARAALARRATS
jgi:hypothetical protein